MNEKEITRYNKDKATVLSIIKYLLLLSIAAVLCYAGVKVVLALLPFLIGFLLSKTSHSLAKPFTKKITDHQKRAKTQKSISIAIYCVLIIIVGAACVWACTELGSQVSRLIDFLTNLTSSFNINEFISGISKTLSQSNNKWIESTLIPQIEENFSLIWDKIVEIIPSIVTGILTSVMNLAASIPYGIFLVVCVLLSGYYFLSDGPRVFQFFSKNVPNRKFRVKTLRLIDALFDKLFRVLGGYLLLLIITAIEAYIAFSLAGVKYSLILAIITGVIDFMPVLGISATMLPVIVLCAIRGNYTGVIILIIAMTVITIVRRWIEPPILGKSMEIHPLLMLISMALGFYIWGGIGFLLGPTVLIIIIETAKVFELDKRFMKFFKEILNKAMEETND